MNSYYTSFYINSTYYDNSWQHDYYLMMLWAEIVKTHRAFISRISIVLDWNPLPILMRAINRVFRCHLIRQPCWRRDRWRSVT